MMKPSFEAATAIASLTHADRFAAESCVLWCIIAIDRAVREQRLDGIWDGIGLLPSDRRDVGDLAQRSDDQTA
jgi:hypothetical protein